MFSVLERWSVSLFPIGRVSIGVYPFKKHGGSEYPLRIAPRISKNTQELKLAVSQIALQNPIRVRRKHKQSQLERAYDARSFHVVLLKPEHQISTFQRHRR